MFANIENMSGHKRNHNKFIILEAIHNVMCSVNMVELN